MVYYRNRNTGQIVEYRARKPRLERMAVWDRVEADPLEGAVWHSATTLERRPNVWLVSPAHGRLHVSEFVFAQRAHLITQLAERGIDARAVVVACDENLDLAVEHGFSTIDMPNTHLGRRFNAGIHYACVEGGADYVVHIGSDDWVHPDFFTHLPGPETILSGRWMLFVDLERGVGRRCHVRTRHGVIPWIIPRHLLERARCQPVKPEKRRGIDGSLIRGIGSRPRWAYRDPQGAYTRIDWKTRANITPYDLIARNLGVGPEQAPWAQLESCYPASLVQKARAAYELALPLAA